MHIKVYPTGKVIQLEYVAQRIDINTKDIDKIIQLLHQAKIKAQKNKESTALFPKAQTVTPSTRSL